MLTVYTDRILTRLQQLVSEVQSACDTGLDFHDRLREFKNYCDTTPTLAQVVGQLPHAPYDVTVDWRDIPSTWRNGKEGYSMRWDAINKMASGGPEIVDEFWTHLSVSSQPHALRKMTEIYLIPIYNFLADQVQGSSAILYILLRYKRWVEWFMANELYQEYQTNSKNGEAILDESLRRFLFESGIDYPFSQPASPGGKVDVVAGLETDDPLVLEIKVWDSQKNYKEDRILDGLRQAIEYSTKYGKDRGHVVVFNLDEAPLSFISQTDKGEWPPRIEYGAKTYYFLDVHIAKKSKPISQQDKGKLVQVNEIDLAHLLTNVLK